MKNNHSILLLLILFIGCKHDKPNEVKEVFKKEEAKELFFKNETISKAVNDFIQINPLDEHSFYGIIFQRVHFPELEIDELNLILNRIEYAEQMVFKFKNEKNNGKKK